MITDELINKEFYIKAKNGKMVECRIIDMQLFSPSHLFLYAEKQKGKKELMQISASSFLLMLKEGKIIPKYKWK